MPLNERDQQAVRDQQADPCQLLERRAARRWMLETARRILDLQGYLVLEYYLIGYTGAQIADREKVSDRYVDALLMHAFEALIAAFRDGEFSARCNRRTARFLALERANCTKSQPSPMYQP